MTDEPLSDVLSPNVHAYAASPEHEEADEVATKDRGVPTAPVGGASAEQVNTHAGEAAFTVFVAKFDPPAFDTSRVTE